MSEPKPTVRVDASCLPTAWLTEAVKRGVEKNILFAVGGAIGDEICAEPTLRYAAETFPADTRISVLARNLGLFRHLKAVKRKYPVKLIDLEAADREKFDPGDYFILKTYAFDTELSQHFFTPNSVHSVDYPALLALRRQLPAWAKEIQLAPPPEVSARIKTILAHQRRAVVVHPGASWRSRTFPAAWWNAVLKGLRRRECTPILIGQKVDDGRGVVPVDPTGTFDLTGALTLMDCVALCQHCPVLLTNDSAPLHMAASWNPEGSLTSNAGWAWIGYFSTVKDGDYLSHWRHGEPDWRMQNLALGGVHTVENLAPNRTSTLDLKDYDPAPWLPEPDTVAEWANARLKDVESIP